MRDIGEVEYICEWCEPSDIPETRPELCKIIYCRKHYCKTWHWPKKKELVEHPTN